MSRRAIVAGLCATLVGVGLGRFAYTPLVPVLVQEGWITPAEAGYVGAANLAGYLAGAVAALQIAARVPTALVLPAMMGATAASFLASGYPLGASWLAVWRFAAGLSGGAVMVLVASAVLPTVTAAQRGVAGGLVFTGVGLGIAASATVVPVLLAYGLAQTWLGLAAIALLLSLSTWGAWPAGGTTATGRGRAGPSSMPARPIVRRLLLLHAQYALTAVGLVAHMVFLVDYVVRGLDRGIAAGAVHWLLFGLGAMAGPMLIGAAADRVGFAAALRLGFAIQALAVGAGAVTDNDIVLGASSAVVGAFVPGIVPLVLGRIHELLTDEESRRRAWRIATCAFALGQAGGAYAYAGLFAATGGDHRLLFAMAAAALSVALAADLTRGWPRRSPR